MKAPRATRSAAARRRQPRAATLTAQAAISPYAERSGSAAGNLARDDHRTLQRKRITPPSLAGSGSRSSHLSTNEPPSFCRLEN